MIKLKKQKKTARESDIDADSKKKTGKVKIDHDKANQIVNGESER